MNPISDDHLEVALRQAQAMTEAQARLRRLAEEEARQTRAVLEEVARAICPDQVDTLLKRSPDGLSALKVQQIGSMVIASYRRQIARMQAAAGGVGQDLEEVLQLRARVRELEARLAELAEPAAPAEPVESTETPLPQTQPVEEVPASQPVARRDGTPPWRTIRVYNTPAEPQVPVENWPEWAREWRAKDKKFERSVDVVLVLGDTGLARRADVAKLIAARWKVTPGSGGITRRLEQTSKTWGLIDVIITTQEGKWRPGYMLRLTERGRDAYRLITGKAPVPSQATELLNRHKSPAHAILNYEVAELLWAAGYEVELFPSNVPVSGGIYRPDLVARLGDMMLYVEAERATLKKASERGRKWELYYRASKGHFAMVTPSETATERISQEVLDWAGERSLILWMTDLERSRDKYGRPLRQGKDVWIAKKTLGLE